MKWPDPDCMVPSERAKYLGVLCLCAACLRQIIAQILRGEPEILIRVSRVLRSESKWKIVFRQAETGPGSGLYVMFWFLSGVWSPSQNYWGENQIPLAPNHRIHQVTCWI